MNTRQNITFAALAAAAITPFMEKHWHVEVTADDVLEGAAALAVAWHFFVSTFGPYAERIFDHYFPAENPKEHSDDESRSKPA